MRVYFEKPRTTVGWKGLINDPDLDDSFHIEKGILTARELLLYIAELGLPAGTEALDPIMPQYLSELITWTAIGARTTESQTHREMASGLSTPVGFKNGTDGALATSLNALQSVRHPHHFLGITQQGQSAVFRTRGNAHAHLVLRGGGGRVNYDAVSIAVAERELSAAGIAGQCGGRLQPWQLQQGSEPPAPSGRELHCANRRRQPFDRRPHARESFESGKPIHPERPEQA
jgi:3-deoxy-7-phosphoheptulonate synthase